MKNVAWAAVWDVESGGHQYSNDLDIVIEDNTIAWVGPGYEGEADVVIDGRDRFAMPGLINVHSHPSTEPLKKGFREEFGNPQMHMSPLYDRAFMLRTDAAGQRAGLQFALVELLKSGVTSVVDLSTPYDGWADTMAASGIRAWLVPSYASASWSTTNGHSVEYVWDEERGHRGLEDAISVATDVEQHDSGRLSAMLGPAQIDTCTRELFEATQRAAADHGWRVHTHAAQSVVEFYEMARRYGRTPVQWAEEIGLLGANTILAHAMFTDEHSMTHWPGANDVRLLAETGTGVAHCPGVFARNGQMLENLGSYLGQGVKVGIGTDSFPHNLIEEMRLAALLARVSTADVRSVTTAQVFHAATAGGAELVGRDDLGRLAVGAKADVVLVDLANPAMMPIRDPLRSLIYTAADRAVCDVFVDGRHVLADGEVATIDIEQVGVELQRARDQAERDSSMYYFDGRSSLDIAPLSLPHRHALDG